MINAAPKVTKLKQKSTRAFTFSKNHLNQIAAGGIKPVGLATGEARLIAPVAQLDRAPDFESVGRTFESCRARFYRNQN
jgi:hypothetical protein